MLYSDKKKKNLATLCSCHGNLNEAGFKNNGLICLVEETTGQRNVQSVAEPLSPA